MPCMSWCRFSFSYCQAVSIWVIGQDQIDGWHFISLLKSQLQGTLALFLGADFFICGGEMNDLDSLDDSLFADTLAY